VFSKNVSGRVGPRKGGPAAARRSNFTNFTFQIFMEAYPSTLSSLVRRILVEGGNKPLRVNALWDTVRSQLPPSDSVSKTFFKRKIIGNMFVRDEVRFYSTKLPTLLDIRFSSRLHFLSFQYLPQLVKLRIPQESESRLSALPTFTAHGTASSGAPLVYAIRLKGSGKVQRTLKRQGLNVNLKAIRPSVEAISHRAVSPTHIEEPKLQ